MDVDGETTPRWSGGLVPLVHCPACNGLFDPKDPACPICGQELDRSPTLVEIDGVEHEFPSAMQGAIPSPTWALLDHIRLEWERPVSATRVGPGPAPRLVIVILFWTLFEVLMERFYEAAFADLPGDLRTELLQRNPSISARLDRLYKRRWGVTFWEDLSAEGYAEAAAHLKLVQARRNAFVHGDPAAIDDNLVASTVAELEAVQLGWVALFNKRCTGMNRKVPIWEADTRTRASRNR